MPPWIWPSEMQSLLLRSLLPVRSNRLLKSIPTHLMMKLSTLAKVLPVFLLMMVSSAGFAKQKAKEPVPLTPAGEKAHKKYAGLLATIRSEIEPKLPKVDAVKKGALMEAYGKKRYPLMRA